MISRAQEFFSKLPPTALEAECALLGSMILDERVITDVAEIVTASDFSRLDHATIYRALTWLKDNAIPSDVVQITQRLSDVHALDSIGAGEHAGVEYLVMLAESVPSATSAPYYARTVRDVARKRRIIEVAADLLRMAYTTDTPAGELADQGIAGLSGVLDESGPGRILDMTELIKPAYDEIEARANDAEDKPMGLTTGLPDLDNVLGGLEPGTLTILAARTSVGKTAMSQQWAEHIAAGQAPVGAVSLEMSEKQLAYRLLAAKAGVGSPHDLHWSKRASSDQAVSEP